MTAKTFSQVHSEGNSGFELDYRVEKMDSDQRLVFGWASVVQKNGKTVIDKQGDMIPIEELEKAAYDFVLHSREGDDMHVGVAKSRCVESIVFTPEKAALGIIAKGSDGLPIYGWFTGFHVDDDALWALHKRGERPQFSIAGVAVKEKVHTP